MKVVSIQILLLFAVSSDAFVPYHQSRQLTSGSLLQETSSEPLAPRTTRSRYTHRYGRSNRLASAPPSMNYESSPVTENGPSLSDTKMDRSNDDFKTGVVDSKKESATQRQPTRRSEARRSPSAGRVPVTSKRNTSSRSRPLPQKPLVLSEPYRAPYQVSLKTQDRIKDAVAKLAGRPDHERAEAALSALLNTPAEQVNEANVVCALTLSAKCMQQTSDMTPAVRRNLFEVLDILHLLARNGRLKARQLCNAIYAVAKHYNKDYSLLPASPEATAMTSEEMVGVAEAWILQDEDEDSPEKRLESTIEMIALSLTESLNDESRDGPRKPHVGEVSMACWAYGVLRQRIRPPGWAVPPQLSRMPSNRIVRNKMKNYQLVTFEQWAVSSDDADGSVVVHDPVGRLFDAVGHFLPKDQKDLSGNKSFVQDMTWSEMANVAWAFANHGHCRTEASEHFLKSLSQEATDRLIIASRGTSASFLPRDISQLVWSLGTLQSDNFRLGDGLVELLDAVAELTLDGRDRPFHSWSSADLVQLAIALAHSRIDHQPLLRTLYREAHTRVLDDLSQRPNPSTNNRTSSFHEWEISVLLWVQARLYLKEDEGEEFRHFVRDAPRWLMKRAHAVASLEDLGIGPQEQANLAWSLTVLEEYEQKDSLALLRSIFKEASVSKNEFIQLEHAHQLWQALYLMQYECPEAVENVPVWFRDFLKEKWSAEKARQKISSARHRSLSKTLDFMGVAHYNEHDEDIDVAIVLKNNQSWTGRAEKMDHQSAQFKVALEFDGPLHFTREKVDDVGKIIPPRTLGHTVLKYRLLKRQGWAVVRVPYYEFDKIPFWASMERQRYLQRLLKTHANIKFSEVDISEYKAITPNRKSRFD